MLSIFYDNNSNVKDKLYWLIVGLYSAGIVAGINKASYIALVLYLIWCFGYKEMPNYKSMFSNQSVKATCKYLVIFLGLYGLSSVLCGSFHGIKETGHYFERILPFFILLFMTYDKNIVLEPIVWGTVLGAVILTSNMTYEQFTYRNDIMGGYLGNHNKAGGWSILILPLFVAFVYGIRNNRYIKVLGVIGVIIIVTCWIVAGSRGAWVGGFAMLAVCGLLYNNPIIRKRILMALLTLVVGIWLFLLFSNTHVAAKGVGIDGTRYDMWLAAWRVFLDNPVLGIGYGNWNSYWIHMYRPITNNWFESAAPHNLLLTHLVDVGILGTSGIAIMLTAQCRFLLNRLKCCIEMRYVCVAFLLAILGMLVHGLVDMIPSNRFYMKLYSFLWAVVIYMDINCQDSMEKNDGCL